MESPGEYLKRERLQRGVELEVIFEVTRVPLDLLMAIEADNFSAVHPAFMKGFIRSYCKHIGIDENDAVLRYEIFIKEMNVKEGGGLEVTGRADAAEYGASTVRPEKNGRRNVVILALLGLVAILLVYVLSPMLSERKEGSANVPVAVLEPAPDVGSKPPAVTGRDSGTPLNKAAAGVDNGGKESGLSDKAEGAAPTVEKKAQALSKHILTIKATEEVWIETWVDKEKPVDVILKPGERLVRHAENGVYVVIGNAGGVEITFDGELIELFGHSGKVVRLKLPSGYAFKVPAPALKPARALKRKQTSPPVKEEADGGR